MEPGIADNFDLTGVAAIGNFREPDLELIAALSPDLIIDSGGFSGGAVSADHVELHDAMQKIAPVIIFDAFGHPKEVYSKMAGILSGATEDAAGRLQEDYESRLAHIREQFPANLMDVKVGLFHFRGEDFLLPPHSLTELIVISDLGVELSAPNLEAKEASVFLSIEQLDKIDSDLLIFLNTTPARVQDLATWESHPAVQAGQSTELPPRPGNGYTRAFQTMDALEAALLSPDFNPDIV